MKPPFREPCKWAANPPETWDCVTHGGTAEDPLDLGRPCQKRMDLALAEIERLERSNKDLSDVVSAHLKMGCGDV